MAAFKIFKLGSDFEFIRSKLDMMIKTHVSWKPATSRTPGAVWDDVSDFFDKDVKNRLESKIQRPLHDIFWMTDYLNCQSLEIHQDNPGNEYPIETRFTMIVMLDGVFKMTFWDDDQTTPIDFAIIHPGELIVLNFSQYYHSGEVLEGRKLSLHGYPIVEEIDHLKKFVHKLNVTDYV